MPQTLILASGSPRRHELLTQMGLQFEVIQPSVDENLTGAPETVVAALARRKAEAVAVSRPDAVVLAADTLVAINGQSLGKPKDLQDAKQMLSLLNGNWHEVHTGVCVIANGETHTGHAVTQVLFTHMSEAEIQSYCGSGEPFGKAGAYAIQGLGGMYIEQIRGSYTNVVGLPTSLVRQILQKTNLL